MIYPSQHVTLSAVLMSRCREQGAKAVSALQAGVTPRSRAFSLYGAENNIDLHSNARAAECAFCLWAGLDPMNALRWDYGNAADHDVVINNILIDVKWAESWKRLLCWPVSKNDYYLVKKFDLMVFVRGDPPTFIVRCWMPKFGFLRCKGIADGFNPRGLTADTWFLHESKCLPMTEFWNRIEDGMITSLEGHTAVGLGLLGEPSR